MTVVVAELAAYRVETCGTLEEPALRVTRKRDGASFEMPSGECDQIIAAILWGHVQRDPALGAMIQDWIDHYEWSWEGDGEAWKRSVAGAAEMGGATA